MNMATNEATKRVLLSKKGKKNDGRSKLPEYKVWKGMRGRCYNPNDKKYGNYGGRGITICERWNDFWNFYFDMGKRPEGRSIDRIDVNKGYSPENCRWATVEMQENNRTTTRFATIGKETKSIKQWADVYGISDQTVRDRIYRGWDVVKAITTPAGRYYGKGKTKR